MGIAMNDARAAMERLLAIARRRWHRSMATVHMTESEVARDLHAVLAKVQQGVEVVG